MDSTDNIDKLLKIEQQAAQIIQEAEEKASRLLIEAKAQSEIAQNQKITQMRKELEADFASYVDSLNLKSHKEIDEYRLSLNSIPLNQKALLETLEALLQTEN
ncbi:MAG TPA: hypothetical protein PLQ30_05380 [Rectinema sp.]|jgi:F0F1-type ATP synthase membrane subunit b/b'|nr:hypothetical protein [Rectinema sp.]HPB61834.1 hypothetical protein [Rectinema sp.]HPW01911.1 hypothetical protein [Rectinema sp.]